MMDTPDTVEALANWHTQEAAHLRAHHALQGSMPELADMHEETAAMLLRLHTRAVDAEREQDEARQRIHDLEVVVENWRSLLVDAKASLATARADALREAEQELADLIHDNTTLMDSLNAAEAALTTARADALREAATLCAKLCEPDGLVPHPVAFSAAILTLIEHKTTEQKA